MPIFAESIFGCTSLERFNIGLTYGAVGGSPRHFYIGKAALVRRLAS